MEQKDTKPVIQYMFYRVYCLSCILIWNVVGIWAFRQQLRQEESSFSDFLILLLPFVLPALFMVFNLFAFPFKYSAFGKYRRTSPPPEIPVFTARANGSRIGWVQLFFTVKLYSSGPGLFIWGVGKAFIPYEDIVDIEKTLFGRYRLRHTNPEVRNPIIFSDKKLYQQLVIE
jgi:hypothetical protein